MNDVKTIFNVAIKKDSLGSNPWQDKNDQGI
jgi:hypothetical protein